MTARSPALRTRSTGQTSCLPLLARLGLLLLGLLALAGLSWVLLTSRPLGAARSNAAPIPGGKRPGFGQPLAGVLTSHPPGDPGQPASSSLALTPPLTETTNILLAGLDTRPGAWSGGRTDSLTVLVVDEKSPHLGLVSIPRDLEVNLPGHPPERINAVHGIGRREGGSAEAGDLLLRQVIRGVLGLPIAHAVYVDHAGFEGLVDELDGITVQVRCAIRDRFIDGRGPDRRMELRLEAGVQRLSGVTALMYARSRHGRGIFDRATRQQAVLVGLRDRLLELGAARGVELIPSLRKALSTDLRTLDMLRLGRRLLASKREHLHGLVLGPKHAEVVIREGGRWVMIPRPDAIRLALQDLFKAPAPGHRPSTCPDMDAALK